MIPVNLGSALSSSTHCAIITLLDAIYSRINHNNSTLIISLDLSSAFDHVCHDKLVKELQDLHIPENIIKIVQNYLQCRTQQVTHNNLLSDTRITPSGVPSFGSHPFLHLHSYSQTKIIKSLITSNTQMTLSSIPLLKMRNTFKILLPLS